jgi:hypothetical protein
MPAVSPLRSWERLLRLLGRFLLGLGILYLFRTTAGPQWARKLFLQYARSANQLRDHPKWYNALTHNCTTNIFQEINATRIPLANASRYDWRIMLPGKGDEMLYESGNIVTGGMPFAQLKEQAHINAAARQSRAADFCRRVREGRVGYANSATP